MDGELARLGDEGETLDPHEVADVQEFLEDGVVQGLVLAGADFVPLDVDLDAARRVLQLHEGGRAHDAAGHDASGDADVGEIALLGLVPFRDLDGRRIHGIQGCRIWIDAQFAESRKGFPPSAFLLVEVDSHGHKI